METLAEANGFGDAKVNLEETGSTEAVAAEIAVAPLRRTDAGNRKRGAVVGQARGGRAKRYAGNEWRAGGAAEGGAGLRGAEVEASICAGDYVVGPTGGNFNDGRHGEAAEETFCEAIATLALCALENGAGHPAMTLIIDGVGALEERETGILRLERRLQIGGIVDGMRVGVTGEHLERMREALGQIKGESVVPGVAIGELGIDAVEGNRHAESAGEAESFCECDLRS